MKRVAIVLSLVLLPWHSLFAQTGSTPNSATSGGEATTLRLVHKVVPVYPPPAIQAGIQGTVLLLVTVATDGTVKRLQSIGGPELLKQAATDAVHQWRWDPILRNGMPVEATTTVNVVFELSSSVPKVSARVGDTLIGARLIHKTDPVYPALAAEARLEGRVVLHLFIGGDGMVKEASVVSGQPLLQQAAIDAVHQWRWDPALRNGHPTEDDTTVAVVFALPPRPNEIPGTEQELALKRAEAAALAEIDPGLVLDIRRLLQAEDLPIEVLESLGPLFDELKPGLLRDLPAGTDSEKIAGRLYKKLQEAVSRPDFFDPIIPAYAKHFSREEIKGLLAFFESPIGRHYAYDRRIILREYSEAAQSHWEKIVIPRIVREMRAEFPELREPDGKK